MVRFNLARPFMSCMPNTAIWMSTRPASLFIKTPLFATLALEKSRYWVVYMSYRLGPLITQTSLPGLVNCGHSVGVSRVGAKPRPFIDLSRRGTLAPYTVPRNKRTIKLLPASPWHQCTLTLRIERTPLCRTVQFRLINGSPRHALNEFGQINEENATSGPACKSWRPYIGRFLTAVGACDLPET